MSPVVRILFISLFVLLGIGLMVYAFRIWKVADREERENKDKETAEDNTNALK